MTFTVPYRIGQLCKSWKEQYRLKLTLVSPGGPGLDLGTFAFGTPSQVITTGVASYYLYPTEKQTLLAQLQVARGSLAEFSHCDLVVRTGDKEQTVLAFRNFADLEHPQEGPNFVDTARLIQAEVDNTGRKVWPWSEPVRDNSFIARLFPAGNGKTVESEPVPFGYMEPVPKNPFPERIESTAINSKGYLTVNGTPYFPVYWTPYAGTIPEAGFPPHALGYKSVDLTKIVYSKKGAPDEQVHADLVKAIEAVKNDPQLFQYELGEGEIQLQGPDWKDHLPWLKQAIAWIRAADPKHIINGPRSWLVGHPGHNEVMQSFVPDWDMIGVETSFEEQPLIRKYAVPLMRERRTAILPGLETYYYQPLEVLRWRGYRSALDGASGVGLCPSGMLLPRPEKVNFLRGLNGEFRGLEPALVADPPQNPIRCSVNGVETMERVLNGRRYLIAVRGREPGAPVTARFDFPGGTTFTHVRCLFEDRTVSASPRGFEDTFAPYGVHVYELTP